ncbi:Predicted DNA-binding transcriptional regulator YafY, contains an HTH and WYL domains [Arsukibacterium tuosuense]|uniref:Predicted DNA-binding transcriptional regulator YafY, contains an HTH and WYL domains n=1 Tax=Arsukibacterium tuosuense TaxID=1323745 RepID=A0A285JDL5_9GAMM|nr:WYL domain-containing protein [Arsukibacterium tuosuense]SNY58369.1 Predicted DNA-binding transcriptional regulator YafY, contains an HTH and WYL domains [Arsukibacterium tuosuense]
MEQLIDAIYRLLPTKAGQALSVTALRDKLENHDALLTCATSKTKYQKVQRQLDKLEVDKAGKIFVEPYDKENRYWKLCEPEVQLANLLRQLSLLQDVIKQRLPASLQQQLDDVMQMTAKKDHWLRKIYVAPSSVWQPPKLDPAVTSVVYQAIEEDRAFSCDYTTIKGKTRRVTLVPWGLMTKAEKVYVLAIERGSKKSAPVTYALISIRNAELAGPKTIVEGLPADTDLRTYCERHQIGSFAVGAEQISLVVRFYGNAGRNIKETPLSDDMQVQELSDDCREVTATAHNSVELRKYLRGFGEQAEVIAPTELRQHMRSELHAAIKRYEKL